MTGDTASPEMVLLPLLNTFKAGLNSPTSPAGPPETLLKAVPACVSPVMGAAFRRAVGSAYLHVSLRLFELALFQL